MYYFCILEELQAVRQVTALDFSITECNSLLIETCGISPLQQSSVSVVIKNKVSNGSCSAYEEEPYNILCLLTFAYSSTDIKKLQR